jgi:tetratricopeptide (TPR) repeat protein
MGGRGDGLGIEGASILQGCGRRVFALRPSAYVKLGQYERAIFDYTGAIKRNSRLAKAYSNRAIAYALSGKFEGARKDLLKAIELNPDLKNQVALLSERFKLNAGLD